MISAATMGMSKIVAGYVDQTSDDDTTRLEHAIASHWLGSSVLQPTRERSSALADTA